MGSVLALCAAGLLMAASASAASASITVQPSSGLHDSQSVSVTGTGFKATQIVVVQCLKSATGASGCNTNNVAFTNANSSARH